MWKRHALHSKVFWGVHDYKDYYFYNHGCVYWHQGGSEAKVEVYGDQDEALIQQSSGVHLLEVNGHKIVKCLPVFEGHL